MSIRENIIKDVEAYLAQWGSMHYIQIGANIVEIVNKHFGVKNEDMDNE